MMPNDPIPRATTTAAAAMNQTTNRAKRPDAFDDSVAAFDDIVARVDDLFTSESRERSSYQYQYYQKQRQYQSTNLNF